MKECLSESVFFGAVVSILCYELGVFCKKKTGLALFNPLLLAIVFVMIILGAFRIDYADYQEGAQVISYLLTPATVCLALPLHRQMNLLKSNVRAILAGIIAGVLTSLAAVFAIALIFQMSHSEYVTLLPKSITTAIGIGVAEELGGNSTITAAVIIVTGVVGNIVAEGVCRIFRIHEPVARGIAIGTSSHAIGTARAIEMGEVEGAMSSLAIAVAGLLTVVFSSVFSGFLR